ncbi:MAG: hypothetical protein ACTIDX_07040 [Hafnia paralvei]|jgi:hypothetical protein|uniref:hypothetical protein n=1 Tax=Hafnia paralvei TaxID=546367 RepID=UPI001CF32AE3|nr:hypothetical protein [Hafnia paralvei]MCE9881338.1 hypothetical protein [Hafnia paralvei]MCE9912368.1 hypothetical protein [Hafnia paralvei]
MSDHECRGDCQCKKVVIPVIFVPDIMGTRLANAQNHKVVWDPMAGMGSYHTPLGTAATDLSGMMSDPSGKVTSSPMVQKLLDLQKKLTALHGGLMALYKTSQKIMKALGMDSLAKRLERNATDATSKLKEQLADVNTKIAHIEKEINNVFDVMGKAEDILRIGRNVWGAISVLEWMFRDAAKRREILVGDSKKVVGRDDSLLEIGQDAVKGSLDKTYFSTMTSVRVQDISMRFKQGWGEVCWSQYGEFLMTLQRHLDARFNIKDVSAAGQSGNIPKPTLPTGKALKDLLAAIESLLDFGSKPATPAAASPAASTAAASPAAPAATDGDKSKDKSKEKDTPVPWGADANFAKVMGGYAFPLHVVGYNWMQGCADAAQRLTTRISQIMGEYQTTGTNETDSTWLTKKPVDQVILVSHGAGGFVVRAMLAGMSPETTGSSGASSGGGDKNSQDDDYMSGVDPKINAPAAASSSKNGSSFAGIQKTTPLDKSLLLKAVHVGLPTNGMPDIYCWFRAGMQTPVSVDWSKPDEAMKNKTLAYISNQVLGADAAEITMVLSYSQSTLECLPNNSYAKGWLCYQPPSFSLVEGEKAPAPVAMAVEGDIYAEYQANTHWYRLLDKERLCGEKKNIEANAASVYGYLDKAKIFHTTLASGGQDNTQQLSGKTSKLTTRDKAVWQAQGITPLPPAEDWVKFGSSIANSNGFLASIDSLLGTHIFSSLADEGKGTLYLTSSRAGGAVLPTEFVLQPGSGEGDGALPISAAVGAKPIEECSEYHDSLYQDQKIRAALYKTLQTTAWEYNAKLSKK